MAEQDDNEINIGFDPKVIANVLKAAKAFERLGAGILDLKTQNLKELAKAGNLTGVTSNVKEFTQQIKLLESLLNNKNIRNLNQANSILGIQDTHNLHKSKLSKQQMNTVSGFQNPAEIRQFTQAMSMSMQDAMAKNNTQLANNLAEQISTLKSVARHKEKVLTMTPREREASRTRDMRTLRNNQNLGDLGSLVDFALKNKRSTVLDKKTPYAKLEPKYRKRATEAQELLISQRRGAGLSTVRAAKHLENFIQAEKDLTEARKQSKKAADQTRNTEEAFARRQKQRDSRAAGTFADQHDVKTFEGRRNGKSYRLESVSQAGLDKLKEAQKAQEKILKLAKDQALATGTHKDKRIAQLEQARLGRMRNEHRLGSEYMQVDPATMRRRSDIARRQSVDRTLGDNGASLFKIQAGLMGNYALMGGGIGLGSAAVGFTLDLDRSMRQLQAILALTNGELDMLSGHLVDVSEKTKFTALEVFDAATTMGQAGFDPDQIKNSIEATTYLATAIGSDLKTAVDLQTSVMGIYDKSSSEMMNVSDKIVTAINTSKLNLEKLTLGMQYSGNISAQLGVTFEENVAALAAMANSGIRSGSTLGTGMRQIYTALQKPSASFAKWMEEAGLGFDDVDIKAKGLYNVLKALKDAGFDMDKASRMWETRAATAVGAVLNNMSEFKDMMSAFDTSAGAAMAANEKQMLATRNQLERLYSILGTLASEGLEPLRAAFTAVVEIIADGLSHLREMESVIKVITTLAVGAIAGKGIGFVGGMIKNLIFGGGLAKSKDFYGSKGKGKRNKDKKTDDSVVDTAINTGIIASLLRGALSGSKAGWIGAGVGSAAALGVWALDEHRENSDLLDKANTELSKNLTLYSDQSNAIRKVNKTLYEMDSKQQLYKDDTEAMSRLSNALQTEFGSLGFVLTGMDGDFDSTKNSLLSFRDALDEAAKLSFPKQSYQDVTDAYANTYKDLTPMHPGQLQSFFGRNVDYDVLKNNPNSTLSAEAIAERKRIDSERQLFWQDNPLHLDQIQKAESYLKPQGMDIDFNDPAQVKETNRILTAALTSLSYIKKSGIPSSEGHDASGSALAEQLIERIDLLTQTSANHGASDKSLRDDKLRAYQSTIFDEYNGRAALLNRQLSQVLDENKVGLATDAPIMEKSRLIEELINPIINAASALSGEVKHRISNDDVKNGTNYDDSYGHFDVLNQLASIKSGIANDYLKQKTKIDTKVNKDIASAKTQTAGKQISVALGEIQFATTTEELDKILTDLKALASGRSKLKLTGKKEGTEEYQIADMERLRALTAEYEKYEQAIKAKRQALELEAFNEQKRKDNIFGQVAGKTQQSKINVLYSQMRNAMTVEEAKKIGSAYIQAITDKNSMDSEKTHSKLPVGHKQSKRIEGLYAQQLEQDTTNAQLRIDQVVERIGNGIIRLQDKQMRSLLSAENSDFQRFLSGQKYVNASDKGLLRKEHSNLLTRLKDPSLSNADLDIVSGLLDEVVLRALEAKAKGIKLQVKDPQSQAELLSNLDEEKRLNLERNALTVHAVKQRRLDSNLGGDAKALAAWRTEFNNDWRITKNGLTERKNDRTTAGDKTQKVVTSNTEMGALLQGQLGIQQMPNNFYQQIQAELLTFTRENIALLQNSLATQINGSELDRNALVTEKAVLHTRSQNSDILPAQRQLIDKRISEVDVEISKLNKDIADLELKREDIAVNQQKEERELNTQVLAKTDFTGPYQSVEYRNRSAMMSGGTLYNPANNQPLDDQSSQPNFENMSRFADAWDRVKVASTSYGEQMKQSYDGFDPMVDAVDKLKDATDQAIQKTASLFSEWAMGAKSGKDAMEDFGKFVLQMLSQIAFQIMVTQMTSAITGMFATGGHVSGNSSATAPPGMTGPLTPTPVKPIGRAVGGHIPRFSGGGNVGYSGKGSRGQDSVAALLTPDEFVIRSHVARDWGKDTLSAINNGELKPEDVNRPVINQAVNKGPESLNVWLVQKPEDAGNGGIGPNDVVAIVENNVSRRGALRTLIKQIALTN